MNDAVLLVCCVASWFIKPKHVLNDAWQGSFLNIRNNNTSKMCVYPPTRLSMRVIVNKETERKPVANVKQS